MEEAATIDEFLKRVAEASDNEFTLKRRIFDDDNWKDPYECMKRLTMNRSDAIQVVKSLRKTDCYKGPTKSYDEACPSPKFAFRTRRPNHLTNGVELYIRLSSPQSQYKVYVESFHESEKPMNI